MIHMSLNFVRHVMMPWDNVGVEEEMETFSWKKFHAKNKCGTSLILALKMESPFYVGLLFHFIFYMHFLNPHDIRCLLGLWVQKRRKSAFLARSLNATNKWKLFIYALDMEESTLSLTLGISMFSLATYRILVSRFFYIEEESFYF